MNKGQLVITVAERAGLSPAEASKAVDATFRTIASALSKGEGVKVIGFGTFEVVDRPEWKGGYGRGVWMGPSRCVDIVINTSARGVAN